MQIDATKKPDSRSDSAFSKQFISLVIFSLSLWIGSVVIIGSGPTTDSPHAMAFFFAALFFHSGIIGSHLVFGTKRLLSNLLFSTIWFLISVLILCFFSFTSQRADPEIVLIFSAVMVGASGLSCILCLTARFFFGLRLHNSGNRRGRGSENFHVRHILITTTVLGVVLAIGRGYFGDYYAGGISSSMVFSFVLLSVVPVLFSNGLISAILIPRWSGHALVISLVVIGQVSIIQGSLLETLQPGDGLYWIVLWINGFVVLHCLVFGYLMRFHAYRLRRG